MPMRVFRLEEDRSGINPNNLVPNEEHKLPASGVRFIVTKRGPFYANSVRVVDTATGRPLIPRIDFECIQMEVEQTELSGKEVCSIIVIRNDNVSNVILVTYQAYGGWLSYSVTAIIEMVEALDLDIREISWGQIIGVPDRLPAAPHRHPLSDVYGWHKLFPGLGAIRDAIITGNQPLLDQFREGIQTELDDLDAQIAALRGTVNNHVNQTGNVHGLHIHQINGLLASEINDLLNVKLDKTARAADSARLFGRNEAEFDVWIHDLLSYSKIKKGIVPAANRAEGYLPDTADLMVTAQGYVPFKTILARNQDEVKTAGIHWAGRFTSAAAMQAVYANNSTYPAPTLVAWQYYYETSHGYGNGGSYTVGHTQARIDLKYAAGAWVNISAD